jgi:hypothetical protein
MGLMDAQEYDPRPAQRRWRIIYASASLLFLFLLSWFWPSGRFRHWHEWSIANKFLAAIEHRDFDSAYGLYNGDSNWKRHAEQYKKYSFSQFTADWGPSGDLGAVSSHEIRCAIEPSKMGFASASGVAVVAEVNGRPDPTLLWIEKKSETITTSPWDRHS